MQICCKCLLFERLAHTHIQLLRCVFCHFSHLCLLSEAHSELTNRKQKLNTRKTTAFIINWGEKCPLAAENLKPNFFHEAQQLACKSVQTGSLCLKICFYFIFKNKIFWPLTTYLSFVYLTSNILFFLFSKASRFHPLASMHSSACSRRLQRADKIWPHVNCNTAFTLFNSVPLHLVSPGAVVHHTGGGTAVNHQLWALTPEEHEPWPQWCWLTQVGRWWSTLQLRRTLSR